MAGATTDRYMTVQEFLDRFDEFCHVPRAKVEAFLEDAKPRVAGKWGAKRLLAHGFQTAHMLATSPTGQQARLAPGDDPMKSTYRASLKELMKETFVGTTVL